MGGSCTKDKFIKESVYEINNSSINVNPSVKERDKKEDFKDRENDPIISNKEKEEVIYYNVITNYKFRCIFSIAKIS
jgi:hypothetical protein